MAVRVEAGQLLKLPLHLLVIDNQCCCNVTCALCSTTDNSTVAEKYAISLYWAVVSTTQVGYGDIVAYTLSEVCYVYCVPTCVLPSMKQLKRLYN